jgi:hypothetical protein
VADHGAGHGARLRDDEELGDIDERGKAAGLVASGFVVSVLFSFFFFPVP